MNTLPPLPAPSKFRKLPVVIDAVQYTEAVRDAYVLDGITLPAGVSIVASQSHPPTRKVFGAEARINTLEGCMEVSLDDWIITGVKGEHYPCKPDIFAATYEPALTALAAQQPTPAARRQSQPTGNGVSDDTAAIQAMQGLQATPAAIPEPSAIHQIREIGSNVWKATDSDGETAIKRMPHWQGKFEFRTAYEVMQPVQPTPLQPLSRDRIAKAAFDAGYRSATSQGRRDFICGILHGEQAHGIGSPGAPGSTGDVK